MGDRETTWTAKGAPEPWMQSLLPDKAPQARILTYGYDAKVVDLRSMVSKSRIGNHARNLLAALTTYREAGGTVRLSIADATTVDIV
jgi:protein SERAC1